MTWRTVILLSFITVVSCEFRKGLAGCYCLVISPPIVTRQWLEQQKYKGWGWRKVGWEWGGWSSCTMARHLSLRVQLQCFPLPSFHLTRKIKTSQIKLGTKGIGAEEVKLQVWASSPRGSFRAAGHLLGGSGLNAYVPVREISFIIYNLTWEITLCNFYHALWLPASHKSAWTYGKRKKNPCLDGEVPNFWKTLGRTQFLCNCNMQK